MRNSFSNQLTDQEIYNFLKEHYSPKTVGNDPQIEGSFAGITRNEDGSIYWTKTTCIDSNRDLYTYAHVELTDLACKEFLGEFDCRLTKEEYPTLELPYLVMMSKKFKDSKEYQNKLKTLILDKAKDLREYIIKIQAKIENSRNNDNSELIAKTNAFNQKETEYINKLCMAIFNVPIEKLRTQELPQRGEN